LSRSSSSVGDAGDNTGSGMTRSLSGSREETLMAIFQSGSSSQGRSAARTTGQGWSSHDRMDGSPRPLYNNTWLLDLNEPTTFPAWSCPVSRFPRALPSPFPLGRETRLSCSLAQPTSSPWTHMLDPQDGRHALDVPIYPRLVLRVSPSEWMAFTLSAKLTWREMREGRHRTLHVVPPNVSSLSAYLVRQTLPVRPVRRPDSPVLEAESVSRPTTFEHA
jgi:hypothetical protein